MIDTNAIPAVQLAQSAQSAMNAWLIVAAGAGAVLTHAYHRLVAGGGLKNIVRRFWSGEATPK